MKFLMSLGPNCEEASVKATSVTEKTVPATPIMAPDIVDKILRAESELFTRKKRTHPSRVMDKVLSKDTSPTDKKIVKQIMMTGKNQNVDSSSFQKNSSFFMLKEGNFKNKNHDH